MRTSQPHNLGLDLVRATEAAALAAARWMGRGQAAEADQAAAAAMHEVLDALDLDGVITVVERPRFGGSGPLMAGTRVGTGRGPALDLAVDPVDGIELLAAGQAGAISAIGAAPRGMLWRPGPVAYLEKLVVSASVAPALVPECLDAPAAWTLALVARAKRKAVRDLLVFTLDRPRHQALIEEIRGAGARVMLRPAGDVAGALLAAMPDGRADVLMGSGGAAEGVIAACAVQAFRAGMLVRPMPRDAGEGAALADAGLDLRRGLGVGELVGGGVSYFTATGVTTGPLLNGVRFLGAKAETHSLVLRGETGTQRVIHAEHATL